MFRILSWYFGAYTCISDFVHVLQNLYMYFRSCMYITELILVLRNLYWYFGSYTCIKELIHVFKILHVYYGTYTYLTDTGGPLGTTELILVFKDTRVPLGTTELNQIQTELNQRQDLIRDKSTRRYYRDYTDTGVPKGTTEQIKYIQIFYSYSLFSVLSYVYLTT